METVAQLQAKLQRLLEVESERAGRDSGFIQRQRQVTAKGFVSGLVLGWLSNAQATLDELCQSMAQYGARLSPQGLAQRFSKEAAECLRQVLVASMGLVSEGGMKASSALLEQFNGVYLVDSTQVALPHEWAQVWPGGANQHQSRAGLKVQVAWDYHGGGLQLSLQPACQPDVKLPAEVLPVGALRLQDAGYFKVEALQAYADAGVFYLCRIPAKVRLADADHRLRSLSAFLTEQATPEFDGQVHLTAKELPCRLLAVRVPDTVLAARRLRLRATAKRKGKPVSAEALALAQWTIIITNLPPHRLTLDQALALLRLRWQIEMLFKLWKQHAQLEVSRSCDPNRILCEIYAKLIGLIIQHALLLHTASDIPNRSLVKCAHRIRQAVSLLGFVLWLDVTLFTQVIDQLRLRCTHHAHLDTRRAKPSHAQILARFA